MALTSSSNYQTNLPWLNLESGSWRSYEPIQLSSSNLVQHSPHPSRVRHIRAFEGAPICVVDTEEIFSKKIPTVLFPPNQYVDNKLKKASMNFNLLIHRETTNLVTSKPTLDTILAMKYFTGLRNTSFRDQQITNINPVTNTLGWEERLHSLTTEALSPIIDKLKNIEKTQPYTSRERCSTSSSANRMYSSSGRLMTSRSNIRPRSCFSRPSTSIKRCRPNEDFEITPDLDTQVFYILGGILQIPDPDIVKAWLLTSTEREKNLMIDILRSALINKDELNVFVTDTSKEIQCPRIHTPAKCFNSTLHTIRENEVERKIDVLNLNEGPINNEGLPPTRPPTSSTFRSSKVPSSRPNTRNGDEWIPNESVVVK